jgi:hypothetical protein
VVVMFVKKILGASVKLIPILKKSLIMRPLTLLMNLRLAYQKVP